MMQYNTLEEIRLCNQFFRRLFAVVLFVVAMASFASAQDLNSDIQKIEQLLDEGKAREALPLARDAAAKYPEIGLVWFDYARAMHSAGDLDGAIRAGIRATTFASVRASAYYNLACAYAVTNHPEEALDALHEAKRAGFADRDVMANDADLSRVRDDPRFVLPVARQYHELELEDGTKLPYSVDLPAGFVAGKEYPILIGPGDGTPIEEQWGSLFWGEDSSQRGWIVVESLASLTPDPAPVMSQLLDELARKYRVEDEKFHIAGFSANSTGAFRVAMALPERFHTLSGMPGLPPPDVSDETLSRLKGVRVSLIVGEYDLTWLGSSQLLHKRLGDLGIESYLEVMPGEGHVLEGLFGGEFMERMQALRR